MLWSHEPDHFVIVAKNFSYLALWRHHSWPVAPSKQTRGTGIGELFLYALMGAKLISTSE